MGNTRPSTDQVIIHKEPVAREGVRKTPVKSQQIGGIVPNPKVQESMQTQARESLHSSAKGHLNTAAITAATNHLDQSDGVDLAVNDSDDEFRNEGEMVGNNSDHFESSDSDSDESDDGSNNMDFESNLNNKTVNDVFTAPECVQQGELEVCSNVDIQSIVKAMVWKELEQEQMKDKHPSQGDDKGRSGRTGRDATTPIRGTKTSKIPNLVKSPSDTMLYTPTLKRVGSTSDDLINKISDFVEGVGLEERPRLVQEKDEVEPGTSGCSQKSEQVDQVDVADKAILQVEKFKANIVALKGNYISMEPQGDDDFFHITCHVDSSLKEKIERGEYVDLEKLLPKERGNATNLSDEKRMELVTKDGMIYFAPVQDRNSCISGLRKWEQTFRVYAAIYSQAQPHRASEIWQYVYVINLAANSYHWDNVAYYDFTFRQMMSQRPQRSWAKQYVQGWNLTMTDNLGNKNGNNLTGNKPAGGSGAGNRSNNNNPGGNKSWKDFCCWKFNKNKCHKQDCGWDHRCTYCGGWNHGFYNCRKHLAKNGGGNSGRSSMGSNNNDRKCFSSGCCCSAEDLPVN